MEPQEEIRQDQKNMRKKKNETFSSRGPHAPQHQWPPIFDLPVTHIHIVLNILVLSLTLLRIFLTSELHEPPTIGMDKQRSTRAKPVQEERTSWEKALIVHLQTAIIFSSVHLSRGNHLRFDLRFVMM